MFYAEELIKRQTLDNTCTRCDLRFQRWDDYHKHVTTVKCIRRIIAKNVSGRSKSEIVKDWEAKNKRGFII